MLIRGIVQGPTNLPSTERLPSFQQLLFDPLLYHPNSADARAKIEIVTTDSHRGSGPLALSALPSSSCLPPVLPSLPHTLFPQQAARASSGKEEGERRTRSDRLPCSNVIAEQRPHRWICILHLLLLFVPSPILPSFGHTNALVTPTMMKMMMMMRTERTHLRNVLRDRRAEQHPTSSSSHLAAVLLLL
jgi:hypothetical protein